MDLSGRTFVVTGASSGIGQATAEALAAEGAGVVLLGRDEQRLTQLARRLTGSTDVAMAVPVRIDLSDFSEVLAAAKTVLAEWPRIDGLVNAAGVFSSARATTVDGYDRMFATNHLGPYLLSRTLMGALAAAVEPVVVNVTSAAHRLARPHDLSMLFAREPVRPLRAYAASKLANVLMARASADTLAPAHVTVVAVDPGVVRTRIGNRADSPRWLQAATTVSAPLAHAPEDAAAAMISVLRGRHTPGSYLQRRFAGQWGTTREATPGPHARDASTAKRLLDESEHAVTQ